MYNKIKGHNMKLQKFITIIFILSSAIISSAETIGPIEKLDPRLDAVLSTDAKIEKLADGFDWSEGPEWVPNGQYLLFSDIPKNTIYKWKEGEGLSVFLRPAGFTGINPPGKEVGTNGLMLDGNGQLVMCDHGNRGIARLNESNYTKQVLVSTYKGRRLNSPNDLVIKSNGDIYFTDPPYGLAGLDDSPVKEVEVNGVYRLTPAGYLTLLTDEFKRPNGIALSPDEKKLYVAQSDSKKPMIKVFNIKEDGTLDNGQLFFDALPLKKLGKKGSPDGMAVDIFGNVFTTGPGGVLILSPDGTHLGTINTGQATANCTFGDDGSVLYITADMLLLRIQTKTKGVEFK
jgi:gluconolactonase